MENVLLEVQVFGFIKDMVVEVVKCVVVVVDGWKKFFQGFGVSNCDLDQLVQYIDGLNLKEQCVEFIDRIIQGFFRQYVGIWRIVGVFCLWFLKSLELNKQGCMGGCWFVGLLKVCGDQCWI